MVVNIEIPTLFPSATWRAGRKRVDPARLADESRGHYSNLRGEVAAKRRRGGPTYNGGKRGEKGMGCSPIPFRGRPGTGCRQDGAVLAQAGQSGGGQRPRSACGSCKFQPPAPLPVPPGGVSGTSFTTSEVLAGREYSSRQVNLSFLLVWKVLG
jgi:hypothetical protein